MLLRGTTAALQAAAAGLSGDEAAVRGQVQGFGVQFSGFAFRCFGLKVSGVGVSRCF